MTKEEKIKYMAEMEKKGYTVFNRTTKKGTKVGYIVVSDFEAPKDFKDVKLFGIHYDEETGKFFVVQPMSLGLSEEVKKQREEERLKNRAKRDIERNTIKEKIKVLKIDRKLAIKQKNYNKLQEIDESVIKLEKDYKNAGRK